MNMHCDRLSAVPGKAVIPRGPLPGLQSFITGGKHSKGIPEGRRRNPCFFQKVIKQTTFKEPGRQRLDHPTNPAPGQADLFLNY